MSRAGERIGVYEIIREIGRGGMGVVYLARDTKLNREVAIKALPQEFALEPDRLARFEREARTLAALNHPNIATIHGFEEVDGAKYLVLEFVNGESLADRLARGAIPMDDALAICAQVAAGLEAAHDAGVIHRDLKPANVVIAANDQVRILDFGLAKEVTNPSDSSVILTQSPTMSSPATRDGVILGTAAYMSPEQARGKVVDKRADVWAFGCVLYESLTGRTAFHGETVSDTLAEILKTEPDSTILPAETPARIRDLLGRCLTKDPRQRMRDIGDARIEIERVRSGQRGMETGTVAPVASPMPLWRRVFPWALAALFGVIALWSVLGGGGGSSRVTDGPVRVSVSLDDHPISSTYAEYPDVAISPDGTRLLYAGVDNGVRSLYLRDLDSFEAVPLRGTDWAMRPFFSPNGNWIGFFAGGELRKMPLEGGAAITLTGGILQGAGASWGTDGDIVYCPSWRGGLMRVSSEGGEATPLTTPDPEKGEISHRWPKHTPDGRSVVFTIKTFDLESFDDASIGAVSLQSGVVRIVHRGGARPQCTTSGHLVYCRDGALYAVPFDLDRLEVKGSPFVAARGLITSWVNGRAAYDVSADGTLVFAPGKPESPGGPLMWLDRTGRVAWESDESRFFVNPMLSPDGRQVAVSIEGPNSDIWTYAFESGTMNRLTFRQANNSFAAWSPDSRWVAFSSDRSGRHQIYRVPADGGADAERLDESEFAEVEPRYTPDGESIVYTERRLQTGSDIRMISADGGGEAEDLLASPADEFNPDLSPDGRWLAYASNESGQDEIYVRPFLRPGAKVRISRDGGWLPAWRGDGRELFYLKGYTLMATAITPGTTIRADTPVALFESQDLALGYDVAPDGQRILASRRYLVDQQVSRLDVVFNWFDELRTGSRNE